MVLELMRAIREKLAERRQPPYRLPDHIDRVQLNPNLLMMHFSQTLQENPAVEVRSIATKTAV